MEWNGEEVLKGLKEAVLQSLTTVAFDPYVLLLRERISEMGPPASSPGDPPHAWPSSFGSPTSLINSICIWPIVEEMTVYVGSTEIKSLYLELGTDRMAPRPFWVDTLMSLLPVMEMRIIEEARENILLDRDLDIESNVNANPLTVELSETGSVAVGQQRSLPTRV